MESYVRRLKWDKEQNKIRARHEELGKPYTPADFPKAEQLMEEVEITREELVELSLSEDEEYDDNKSRKSFGTVKMLSEWTKSNLNYESPELFRLKARMRMISSSKKFSLTAVEQTG